MLEYTNETSGYEIIVKDDADLLTDSEETLLAKDYMTAVSDYSNVVFLSLESNPFKSSEDYAANYLYETFDREDSIVFMIDMDYRYVYTYSYGHVHDKLSKAKTDAITDNVYKYAKKGDYYTCATSAYSQIYDVCSGHSIRQPMRFVSSLMLAIILAFLINYFVVKRYSHGRKPTSSQLIDGINYRFNVLSIHTKRVNSTKLFSPLSRGRGQDGGNFRGSGLRPGGGAFHGGGGRGHNGGGSGHRF